MQGTAARAEPLTLDQAFIAAYQFNPSLQAERAKLRAADEQVSLALSHWRPSIDGTVGVGKNYQYTPSERQFGTSDFAATQQNYGVQLTQPLFRGFRTLAETEAAEKRVSAERAQLNAAEQQLFLDSGKAFLDTVRDRKILALDHENEQVLEKKLEETRFRSRLGDQTRTDLHQAESRLARVKVNRFQTQNTLKADEAAFTRLTGLAPEKLTAPVMKAPTIDDEAIHQQALDKNPAVIAASYAVDAAKADIDLSRGSLLPEVNLVGNASHNRGQASTLPGREDAGQVLVQLTMPLYRSGADYARTRAAEQTATQRRMELEDARHKAVEQAENAIEAYRTAKEALDADISEVEAATDALEGVKIESRVGTRTTLDVLNAEQELLDAKIEEARTRHDLDYALLQIKFVIGTLTIEGLNLDVDAYDPDVHYTHARGQWIGFSDPDDDQAHKPARLISPVPSDSP